MELQDLRAQIDQVDDGILDLFQKRMDLSSQIAAYKKEHNLPIYVPEREREILQAVATKTGADMAGYAQALYSTIFALSRRYQASQNESIGQSKTCGLLGRTLAHSYSPQIHSYLGTYPYDLFEIEPEGLEEFLKNGNFYGLNVTMPYKKAVIPYCTMLTPCAEKLGSVNTLMKQPDGTLIGHNTDYFGFQSALAQMNVTLTGKKALVLGSGGASATAVAVLTELGAQVIVISRSGKHNYFTLNQHSDASIIVNTTPVGMYPNAGDSLVNLDDFPHLEAVLDLIYNPSKTRLLLDAKQRNIPCQNGLWMLIAQAKASAEWFTGQAIDDAVITHIYQKLQQQTENIILIGMPGCGKSTVGKLLAQALNRPFADTDAEIMRKTNKTIPAIFAEVGEAGFRKLETQVLAELGQKSSYVIATGGGCVTKEENYALLHQNGKIYWLERDCTQLPTEGRPLSQRDSLAQMYAKRKPLYEAFADAVVWNNQAPCDAVNEILKGRTV